MRENREGNKVEVPEPPLEYVVLQYAQKMHVSYLEAAATPAAVMFRHLDMFRLEAEYATPRRKVG